ncbi:hypothetical protein HYU11_04405 [Candidatus Woesearchaeota archaeon]|nr:hypothetical protein [Candidatus Woesearchaeota archaeon]
MAGISLCSLIELAGKDSRTANENAKKVIVPYSGQDLSMQYPHYRNPSNYETPAQINEVLDFRFDSTWSFFLAQGGVSVLARDAYYPKSWLRYAQGIHNGHMLDLRENVTKIRRSELSSA